MTEHLLANLGRDVLANQCNAERLAVAQALEYRLGPSLQLGGMALHELHGRQHLAMAHRLEKANVAGVGVEDVHRVEIHAPQADSLAQMPPDDDVTGDRRWGAIAEEEKIV